ncbi:PLP-dependent aminotransferase family protein [Burkholderia multivorans]|uniref:MocR-like pyridoxine biosynthesis transcription factor PdxR n=1 Tax=Burkholderia multivorans TaxID=87883 RepID=UPI001C24EEB3|nr:PLP-dependent aminotransferase family protein [Burkholderia multivorans]MBU9362326.1 PLP-dependent aminotransferase family protein [Burkholderia multivorans]MBU9594459.1 PLP-dependent aminotransferase family protein [Burkholderia multivorans]MCA8482882.1 PLP-dependent aminotransferase family protein [Burkholderia multivorans]
MSSRTPTALWAQQFRRSSTSKTSLQDQIRRMLVAAILDGQLGPDAALPSSRELADQLGVARNTVVLAYQMLVEEGYLISRERSGHFVNPKMLEGLPGFTPAPPEAKPDSDDDAGRPAWHERIAHPPSRQRNIVKPANWQHYEFPFIYGQFDQSLFPTNDWRECCLKALSVMEIRNWAPDLIERDDESLIQQIRTRVLPRRGVFAMPDEIVVTNGCQQALYLIADLLCGKHTTVGFENPGYPDARNIFENRNARLLPLPVDGNGIAPDEQDAALARCDYVYVTPSHQCPTTATMPVERRRALLERARQHDFVIIEDDYESENTFSGTPHPALKSLDSADRVIYVGSLSKTFAPGLRLGYVVGPRALIRELRALRRLMVRHPVAYIQRAFATFLALGHHDALLRRLAHAYSERSQALMAALDAHLPDACYVRVTGGASCWVEGPPWLDAVRLAADAQAAGILIEPGDVFFMNDDADARRCFRMGFSAIPLERIDAGVQALAQCVNGQRPAG